MLRKFIYYDEFYYAFDLSLEELNALQAVNYFELSLRKGFIKVNIINIINLQYSSIVCRDIYLSVALNPTLTLLAGPLVSLCLITLLT